MKKVLLLVAACAAIMACDNKAKTAQTGENVDSAFMELDSAQTPAADSLRFEGVVPAADGPGIRYQIAIANDTTEGFTLVETYLEAEGGKDQTFTYTGKKETVKQTVKGEEKTAYKFNLDKDGGAEYFLLVNDSTLRLVNDKLEESATKGLNYDLKRK